MYEVDWNGDNGLRCDCGLHISDVDHSARMLLLPVGRRWLVILMIPGDDDVLTGLIHEMWLKGMIIWSIRDN